MRQNAIGTPAVHGFSSSNYLILQNCPPVQAKARPMHPTTISGFTTTRTPDHRGHMCRRLIQKKRSSRLSEGPRPLSFEPGDRCRRARTSGEVPTPLRKNMRMATSEAAEADRRHPTVSTRSKLTRRTRRVTRHSKAASELGTPEKTLPCIVAHQSPIRHNPLRRKKRKTQWPGGSAVAFVILYSGLWRSRQRLDHWIMDGVIQGPAAAGRLSFLECGWTVMATFFLGS